MQMCTFQKGEYQKIMRFLVARTIVVTAVLALGAASAKAQDAAALYKQKCQVCHGPDGKGTSMGQKVGAKDFHAPEVQKMTDQELFDAVKNGKGKMTSYKALGDDQIKDLVKFVRSLK